MVPAIFYQNVSTMDYHKCLCNKYYKHERVLLSVKEKSANRQLVLLYISFTAQSFQWHRLL